MNPGNLSGMFKNGKLGNLVYMLTVLILSQSLFPLDIYGIVVGLLLGKKRNFRALCYISPYYYSQHVRLTAPWNGIFALWTYITQRSEEGNTLPMYIYLIDNWHIGDDWRARADGVRPILYHIVQRGLHITTGLSVGHLWTRCLWHTVHSLP